jgi:hypothetical protein
VLRANVVIERSNIPSVAVTSNDFAAMGNLVASALGIDGVPLAIYPGVIMTDSPDAFASKTRSAVADEVIAGLVTGTGTIGAASQPEEPEPARTDIVAEGELDEIHDFFYERRWSDGLPFVPPTPARVEEFLTHTNRDPSEVLGAMLPDNREATVWNTAVNGVMAGCRPEYMPILLAVVEALADPAFRIRDGGSTPGWEPLVTVSGKIASELDFNWGTGALRVGRRPNATIGRFTRLYMRNIAGLRPPPSASDQGAIGTTFNMALAEDEASTEAVGWEPHRVDRGFEREDDVVTVRSVYSISAPIYSGGDHAGHHLEIISRVFGETIGAWCYHAYVYQDWHCLLVLGPSIAKTIAADGYSKNDVRRYLYDNTLIDSAWVERYAPQVSGKRFDWGALASEGKAPIAYAEATDPHHLVRQFLKPEWIDIIVAGNPGRNQSRAYVGNHGQGVPVSKRVQRPSPQVGD